MEAQVADRLPAPPGWSYEPKWDGFRVVIWSRSEKSEKATGQESGGRGPRLDSRNAKPLLRYFPELEPALRALPTGTVLDGEIVIVSKDKLDFDELQNRIHPTESRVKRLSVQTPARIALFDVLALRGQDLRALPLAERRTLLVELCDELGVMPSSPLDADTGSDPSAATGPPSPWLLSPSTTDLGTADRWFHQFETAGFDGIVAKPLDLGYAEGRRAMVKVKHRRTVDCVVGGFRVRKDGRGVASLLLGLYNQEGELHFIGHCSSFGEEEAVALLEALLPMSPGVGSPADQDRASGGFGEHARHPGATSRWSKDRDLDYVPLPPELVVEVSYDQLTADRFRHATRLERWRPDKDPRDCTMDQLERPKGPSFSELVGNAVRHAY